jgi:hypothetical protein
MPNESQSPRSYLEEARLKTLGELRRRVPELITEYLKLTAAIDAMDSTEGDDDAAYSGVHKPLDAIEAYLENTGKPASRESIARALAEGGWGLGRVKRPYWNLLSMLDYHFSELKSEPRFKEINGLVGKVGWPDEMFALKTNEPPHPEA